MQTTGTESPVSNVASSTLPCCLKYFGIFNTGVLQNFLGLGLGLNEYAANKVAAAENFAGYNRLSHYHL